MSWLTRVLDAIDKCFIAISGIAVTLMAVHIVFDVTARTLFNSPLPGTVEFVSRYYMVILVFLPLAYVQKRGAHFVAGLFTDKLADRSRQILDGITALTMSVVAGVMAWAGVYSALYATRNGEQVQAAQFVILTWPGRWLVPLGLGLMAVYALVLSLQAFAGRKAGSDSLSSVTDL